MIAVDLLNEATDLRHAREAFLDSHPDGVAFSQSIVLAMYGDGDIDEVIETADELDEVSLSEKVQGTLRAHGDDIDRFAEMVPDAARTLNYYVTDVGEVDYGDAVEARESLRAKGADIDLTIAVSIRPEDLEQNTLEGIWFDV